MTVAPSLVTGPSVTSCRESTGLRGQKVPGAAKATFFETTGEARSGGFRQVAEFLQLPDPARCIAFDHEGLVVDGGVSIRNLARQQNEHRFEHFMGDGDDGPFGPPTNDQALEVALELRGGSASGPGDLAQDRADVTIARCGFAAFVLAGRFVVARTHAGPLGESVGGSESGHVDTDFH